MGCFSRPQIPLLPQIITTGSPCRTRVSTSISENPAAPSPSSSTTWADGREIRARIEPPARAAGLDVLARVGHEVPAVADHHGVVVQHPGQLTVDAHRVDGV